MISITPLLVTEAEARQILGRLSILRRMERAGWVQPIERTHKCKVFAYADLVAGVSRMRSEPLPVLPRGKSSKSKHTQETTK